MSFLDWLLGRKQVVVMSPRRVLRNRAQCGSCGDVIESLSEQDCPTCSCGALSVSGGLVSPQQHVVGPAPIFVGPGRPLPLGHAAGYTDLSEYGD